PGLSTSRVDTGLTYFGQPIFVNLTSVKPPDGSLHELVSGDGSSLVTDGSGYRGDSYIRDSSGTKYSVNGFAEDPNGNQVSVSSPSSIGTDPLARQIPAARGPASPAATPPPASTASLSACPVLNYAFQPVTFAYTWNLPTTNGGTLPLIVCFASVYVRTDFFGGLSPCHFFDLSKRC